MENFEKSPRGLVARLSWVAADQNVIVLGRAICQSQDSRGRPQFRFSPSELIDQAGQVSQILVAFWRRRVRTQRIENRDAGFCEAVIAQPAGLPKRNSFCKEPLIGFRELGRAINRFLVEQGANQLVRPIDRRAGIVGKPNRIDGNPAVILVDDFDVGPVSDQFGDILRVPGCRGIVRNREGELPPERVPNDLKTVDDQVELTRFVRPARTAVPLIARRLDSG